MRAPPVRPNIRSNTTRSNNGRPSIEVLRVSPLLSQRRANHEGRGAVALRDDRRRGCSGSHHTGGGDGLTVASDVEAYSTSLDEGT